MNVCLQLVAHDTANKMYDQKHLKYLRTFSSKISDFNTAVIPKSIFDYIDEITFSANKAEKMKEYYVEKSTANTDTMCRNMNCVLDKYWSDAIQNHWTDKWNTTLQREFPYKGNKSEKTVKHARHKWYTSTNRGGADELQGGPYVMLEYTKMCILLPIDWAQTMTGELKSLCQIIHDKGEQFRLLSKYD